MASQPNRWVRAARDGVASGVAAGALSTATLAARGRVAALAALVDYTVTPRRLRPGYEKRVSAGSLLATYGAFAVGLALSDVLSSRAAVTRPADPPDGRGPLSR